MNGKLDADTINKGLDIVKNVSKLTANLSDSNRQRPPQQEKKQENLNQPHTQTVEVKVGDPNGQKPAVIREKNETHVHKVFPDNRELSERECEVEKLRLQNEHDIKVRELEYRIKLEDEARRERKERTEYERREAERRRNDAKKFNRRLAIGLGAAGTVCLGLAAWDIYSGIRNPSRRGMALHSDAEVKIALNPDEGSVK